MNALGRPPKPAVNLAELQRVSARIARYERQAAALKPERARLIRDAVARGGSHRAIADAAGLASQRIAQILKEQEQP